MFASSAQMAIELSAKNIISFIMMLPRDSFVCCSHYEHKKLLKGAKSN
jgi:hypothetical protein